LSSRNGVAVMPSWTAGLKCSRMPRQELSDSVPNGEANRRRPVQIGGVQGLLHVSELGGKVLGPMIKRIAPDAEAVSVVSMDDLEALVVDFLLELGFDGLGLPSVGSPGGLLMTNAINVEI
jgi:hypothetical protein